MYGCGHSSNVPRLTRCSFNYTLHFSFPQSAFLVPRAIALRRFTLYNRCLQAFIGSRQLSIRRHAISIDLWIIQIKTSAIKKDPA